MSDSTGRASELLPSKVTATCRQLLSSRRFGILVAVMVPLLARLAVFPVEPIPVPWVHDEFGYLLAAQTFASGRLTNPTPPMWEHFETFNVLMKPTYMSKYPPGQGALLGAGIVLFGDPWWAVFLSVGVMCGALTWMLQAWFSPPWALLGGVLAGLQFGLAHNWMNSYWGGSLAGIGGCLVLGAYGHLRNRQLAGASPNGDSRVALLLPFVLGTGLSILACTRPYEGLFLAAPVAVALLIRRAWRNAAQVAALVLCGAAPGLVFLLAESRAVTGEWFTAPHEVYRRQMEITPPFAFQSPTNPPPIYRHEEFRKMSEEWEPNFEDTKDWGTLRGLLPGILERGRMVGSSFFPGKAYLPIAALSLLVAFRRRMRILGICIVCVLAGGALPSWLMPYYLAPLLPAFAAVYLEFLRLVRQWVTRGWPIGLGLFALVLMFTVVMLGERVYVWVQFDRVLTAGDALVRDRPRLAAQLGAAPGRHMIFVHYGPSHDALHEWVYNEPDIPKAKVIWARAMTPQEDLELVKAFSGRKYWILEVDDNTAVLRPFESSADLLNKQSRVSAAHGPAYAK